MSTPPARPSVFAPSTLAPVEIDLRRVFRVGIALWTLALVVVAVATLTGVTTGRAVPICIAGLLLGGLALGWEHRRARRAAALEAREAPAAGRTDGTDETPQRPGTADPA
ncbi:DUF2530 domain-containing protein [Actinotalea sp.]|uniref:DUF2530 domain-containing protein n=1 Tax=Actinotalea sp. TaxID=1872145 RepID=UPI002BEC08B5|nr:DUF2530 domain-containing protein [Actinotalea sp.]HQY34092.1 DUF2530 domain-containing protein [Actinotalea sp.]HRA50967.1 DUF2530 domain-containing protein [Actinotalea sp.]